MNCSAIDIVLVSKLFIPSFRSFVCLFVRSLIHSFIHSFMHFVSQPFISKLKVLDEFDIIN